MTDFLVAQSREGPPIYPNGVTNYYDALAKVEEKLAVRYVAEREAEHQHQLQPLPTPQSIYESNESKQNAERMENLCLVRAYQTLPNWKERRKYLADCGYDYPGTNSAIAQRLNKKVDKLTLSGEWDKLVEVAEL